MKSKVQNILEQINNLTEDEKRILKTLLLKEWGTFLNRSYQNKFKRGSTRGTRSTKTTLTPISSRNSIKSTRPTLKNLISRPEDQLPGNPTTKAPAPKSKKSTKNK